MPRSALSALLLVGLAAPASARQRPTVAPADYGKWESPGPAVLSPDGKWLAYVVNRVNEENELRLRSLTRDSTRPILYASAPAFSGNSRWMLVTIGVSPAERDRLTQDKKPVQTGVGILDLASGALVTTEKISSARLSPDGRFVALRGYPADAARRDAADLLVRDLVTGTVSTFGNVSGFAWADRGAMLAFTVETETGAGNGVQLLDAATGRLRALHSSTERYRGLAWRKDALDLAVLQARPSKAFRDTTHAALAWIGLQDPQAPVRVLEPETAPTGLRISDGTAPSWTRTGGTVLVGLRTREPVTPQDTSKRDASKDKVSDVQVWRARDVRIIPMQKSLEQQDVRRAQLAAWRPATGTLVRVADDLYARTEVLEGSRYAIETSAARYPFGFMYGRPRNDVTVVDMETGARRQVDDSVRFSWGGSATGRYLLSYHQGKYSALEVGTGRRIMLTVPGAELADQAYDSPTDERPPYGIAGWTADDQAVLVYDKHDIWKVRKDGSGAERLTRGAEDSTIYRYIRLDREERGIDLAKPVYLSTFGDRSKKSGYSVLSGGTVRRLIWDDARVVRLIRADSAPVLAYTRERFDDAPDWFVAGPTLADARQVSAFNPFMADVAWGKAELVGFTSAAGRNLQGVLLYPANHDPGRKYPMIVYTYELLSQNVHGWLPPTERSYYNFAVWTQQGYFVLLPDIVYRDGEPGRSAVDAVVPAVRSIVARGLVDSARVGLIGHSWGGYQATYIPTQTDIFAASVAGAPITNFLSFAGAVHWTPGIAEFDHWETGQARMGAPPWEAFEAHVRNSPAASIANLKTPMLMEFGDADGTVDWHQGIEFYNFARRAGKQDFVMLVYPGEDHGLRKKENQVDYHRRILQWFGHWLKGEPEPDWFKHGVSWADRKRLLEANK